MNPKHILQDTPRNAFECLLQVHKRQVDWLHKLPCTFNYTRRDKELPALNDQNENNVLLLNLRIFLMDGLSSPYPCTDLPGRLNRVFPYNWRTPPVPLLKNRNQGLVLWLHQTPPTPQSLLQLQSASPLASTSWFGDYHHDRTKSLATAASCKHPNNRNAGKCSIWT